MLHLLHCPQGFWRSLGPAAEKAALLTPAQAGINSWMQLSRADKLHLQFSCQTQLSMQWEIGAINEETMGAFGPVGKATPLNPVPTEHFSLVSKSEFHLYSQRGSTVLQSLCISPGIKNYARIKYFCEGMCSLHSY